MAGFKAAVGDEILAGSARICWDWTHFRPPWSIIALMPSGSAANYGSEWDLAVSGKWHHFAGLLKYADCSAASTTPSHP
jgi:hypothetical protein